MPTRRHVLSAALGWPALQAWAAEPNLNANADAEALLRQGGVVVAMRHALAPGTYDPPGFRLGDCKTQRNLSDDGRAQARRIGAWFDSHSLRPARVRSSPWCRCIDTATLAFGKPERWAALGSPRGSDDKANAAHLRDLQRALAAATAQRGRFDVWVTHMFVLSSLVGGGADSGEGLLLQTDASGTVRVLARLPLA